MSSHGQQVDHALDEVRRLRPPGAAVGIGGGLIGEDAAQVEAEIGELVTTGGEQPGEGGNPRREELIIRPHVGEHPGAQAGDRPIAFGGELDVLDLVAAVDGRDEILAAVLHPLHRTPQSYRQMGCEHVLGIDIGFAAETTANLWGDDTDAVLRQVQRGRDISA